jgi:hypothetical protein
VNEAYEKLQKLQKPCAPIEKPPYFCLAKIKIAKQKELD